MQVAENKTKQFQQKDITIFKSLGDDGPTLKFVDELGECVTSDRPNCFVPVVIKPDAFDIINKLCIASSKNDTDEMTSLIESNYETLSNCISDADLEYLLNHENISVKLNSDISNNGIIFLFIYNNETLFHVYQYTILIKIA